MLRKICWINVNITTAGFFSPVAFHTLLNVTGTRRGIYSAVNYPFVTNEEWRTVMQTLKINCLVTRE